MWFDLWEHERNPAPVVAMLNVAREEIKSELAERIRSKEQKGSFSAFWQKTKDRLRLLGEDTRLLDIGRSLVWGVATTPDVSFSIGEASLGSQVSVKGASATVVNPVAWRVISDPPAPQE